MPQEPAFRLDYPAAGVARITFDQPGSRANTLGQAVLAELETVLAQLERTPDLRGVVLCSGKPGMFVAGADLKELGAPGVTPAITRGLVERGLKLIARIENLPCPTVALVAGACLGGGLELALGFDYRIAGGHPKTEFGAPEVKIGLIPGWGGTQRLQRIIGPSLACDMVCTGDSISAARAKELGLVFDVLPSDDANLLLQEGLRLLEWSRQANDFAKQRERKRQPVGLTEEQHSFTFGVARALVLQKTKGQLPAPLAGLDAIARGCNLPLEEALKIETDLFVPLVGSTISRNLIAVFFMNQRIAKDPGVADAALKPRQVNQVGVIGAGIMGSGIAGAHIRRGVPTLMLDVAAPAVEKGVGNILKVMQSRVEIGRMSQQDVLRAMGLLQTTQRLAHLADRDVVIEAVVENEQVKTALYQELRSILPDNAILASNTSTISITRMAASWKKPENFAGMHFFNPVERMQLVEVIRGASTSDETVATLVALAKRVGKSPIVVKDCPGFLVNRILFPYINESLVLLEEGAEPRAIDRAAVDFGMPMGPITLNDLVGLDTALYAGRVVNSAFADRARSSRILDELVQAGRLGQKSGAGFYSYAKGSRGVDDPAFAQILEKCRTGHRTIGQEEITDRLFLSMLVEASLVLDDGIVREPADVDMGLILGLGFPAWRGGLLRWADTVGLDKIVPTLAKYEPLGPRFRPTDALRRLAAAGRGFYA